MALKRLGVVLWAFVLVYGGVRIYNHLNQADGIEGASAAVLMNSDGSQFDGRVFVEDFPWKRLPQIGPFKVTERNGDVFDSREMVGKPYVVSFFFTRCPTICRELNQQTARLANRFADTDLLFVGLSTDSKHDTVQVLRDYANTFECEAENWLLATAGNKQYEITQFARNQLATRVDGDGHHTSDLFLIDRWGRFRDRFSFNDPREMKRFDQVVADVMAETEPPLNKKVSTRNVAAAYNHDPRSGSSVQIPWLNDFQLTDLNDKMFLSRDLTGQVWIGSFFFSRCGTVCPRQNAALAKLQPEIFARKSRLVSITTDPDYDQPEILRTYARNLKAEDGWHFLTGDSTYIQRVGSEFLGISAHGAHHSSQLVVVDRWGNVRGRFKWESEEEVAEMLRLVDKLNKETEPNLKYEIVETK